MTLSVQTVSRAISDATGAALGWLGRQGTRAMAASVFLGVALPPLAAVAKPLFTPVLFALICISFLRVSPQSVRSSARRPVLIGLATAWTIIGMPLATGVILTLSGLMKTSPDVSLALIFQTVAPPINSSVGMSALIGLDSGFALVTLLASSVVVPFSAAGLTALFGGPAMTVSPWVLGLELWGMITGAAAIAFATRRIKGAAWVDAQKQRLDGANVICMFVFAVALMDDVLAQTIAKPAAMAGLLALAFATWSVLFALTAALFWRAAPLPALTIAFMTACHNTGLVIAAAGTAPDIVWLYLAMLQFPIYLAPQTLKALVGRLRLRET